MKLLLDENLSPWLVEAICGLYPGSEHVHNLQVNLQVPHGEATFGTVHYRQITLMSLHRPIASSEVPDHFFAKQLVLSRIDNLNIKCAFPLRKRHFITHVPSGRWPEAQQASQIASSGQAVAIVADRSPIKSARFKLTMNLAPVLIECPNQSQCSANAKRGMICGNSISDGLI